MSFEQILQGADIVVDVGAGAFGRDEIIDSASRKECNGNKEVYDFLFSPEIWKRNFIESVMMGDADMRCDGIKATVSLMLRRVPHKNARKTPRG